MDPSAGKKPLSKGKSLQDLSAAKILQVLKKDDNAIQTFNSLESAAQQVLFPYIWQDYQRLLEEGDVRLYEERCNYFRTKWKYRDPPPRTPPNPPDMPEDYPVLSSNDFEVVQPDGCDGRIELCCCAGKPPCKHAGVDISKFVSWDVLYQRVFTAFGRGNPQAAIPQGEKRPHFWRSTSDGRSRFVLLGGESLLTKLLGMTFVGGGSLQRAHDIAELMSWLLTVEPPKSLQPV